MRTLGGCNGMGGRDMAWHGTSTLMGAAGIWCQERGACAKFKPRPALPLFNHLALAFVPATVYG
jgi:hypothetical protein